MFSKSTNRAIFKVFRFLMIVVSLLSTNALSQDSNRLTYLDRECDPYYPHVDFAKLTTPQWSGEQGVEAVITLGIDDMRDSAKYEAYLRPILDRLKKIDGRAPVSIMTCSIEPNDPHLQKWLKEGVSIECHTVDHPCPCLQGGSFDRAKSTYDRCVDMMNEIPGSRPVAFRFPCCDSLNTPSPRAFQEIINRTTERDHFLQLSTSVTCLFTPDDPEIPAALFRSGKETASSEMPDRFKQYVPFPSFVNQIQNYPYPYLIGGKCWEFPIMIPDDWQGQNINRPNNPKTVDDMKAAIDASVAKKGVANIVFHPHGWIRAEQMVQIIDYVDRKYGERVKFLTFRECIDRINNHLLVKEPVRALETGADNGVRILDLNDDRYSDVMIGNERKKIMRVWRPKTNSWEEFNHAFDLRKVKFGIRDGRTWCIEEHSPKRFHLHRLNDSFEWDLQKTVLTVEDSVGIRAVRLRDLDHDGQFEVIVGHPSQKSIFRFDGEEFAEEDFPVSFVDAEDRGNGARFVDLDSDSFEDLIISNDTTSAAFLYNPTEKQFKKIKLSSELPRIVSEGKNNGAWFANKHLWIQNEHTQRLPDGVDRKHFDEILSEASPNPRSPEQSLQSISVHDDFQVELMASEPLVQDPIYIEWGVDGKLWGVEMADYPLGVDDHGKPGGRVRYLEDTDRDGKYDRSVIFVDQIPFPTGVLPINVDPKKPACLISAAPYLIQVDQPGTWQELLVRAEKKDSGTKVLLKGFREGNQQHRFNGFSLGLDNWIYIANGDSGGVVEDPASGKRTDINGRDLRIRLKPKFQFEAQSGRTQFGRHCDDQGNWFGCSNPVPIRHFVLSDHYLKRNPNYKYPAHRNDLARSDNTQLFPTSRILSHWSGYRPPKPGEAHVFTSACSTNFYRDNLFGQEFEQNTFTCEPVHNLVHRRILSQTGATFTSRRANEETNREFLASTDSWFRPTSVTTGPDGTLWVTDMYRLVIEHPEWIDDQEEKQLFLRAGHDRGRIYRVSKNKSVLRDLPPRLKSEVDNRALKQSLLAGIVSPNRWYREFSQFHLVHSEVDAESELREIFRSHKSPLARLHALCTLDGRGEVDRKLCEAALSAPDPVLNQHAIRIAEPFIKQNDDVILRGLEKLKDAPEIQVRMQLAYSLGYSSDRLSAEALTHLGNKGFNNIHLRAAVMSSLNEQNIKFVVGALREKDRNRKFALMLADQAMHLKATFSAFEVLDSLDFEAEDFDAEEIKLIAQTLKKLLSDAQLKEDDKLRIASKCFALAENRLGFSSSSEVREDSIQPAALELYIQSTNLMGKNPKKALVSFLDPQFDISLQLQAVELLAEYSNASVAELLISKWRRVTPEVRAAIQSALLQRADWSQRLIDAISSKQLPESEMTSGQRQKLLDHPDAGVARRAAKLFKNSSTGSRTTVLAKYQKSLSQLADRKASLKNGRELFERSCAKCHKQTELGNQIGPDLRSVKDRSQAAFLQAILDPNRAVEDKYRTYLIALTDGRQISGMIESESSSQIQVAFADGKQVQILRNRIEHIKSLGKSLMPEGLEKELPPEAMQDLLSFLLSAEFRSPDSPPKNFAGNKPGTVTAKDDGNLALSAENCSIYGDSLVFESKYKNLGFWRSSNDEARWSIELKQTGNFEVWLNYACDDGTAGNRFKIQIGGQSLSGKVAGTGSWDNYKQVKLGRISLQPSDVQVNIQIDGKSNGYLMDLKSIELKRIK